MLSQARCDETKDLWKSLPPTPTGAHKGQPAIDLWRRSLSNNSINVCFQPYGLWNDCNGLRKFPEWLGSSFWLRKRTTVRQLPWKSHKWLWSKWYAFNSVQGKEAVDKLVLRQFTRYRPRVLPLSPYKSPILTEVFLIFNAEGLFLFFFHFLVCNIRLGVGR